MKNISLHWLQGIFETVPKLNLITYSGLARLDSWSEVLAIEHANWVTSEQGGHAPTFESVCVGGGQGK